MNADELITDLLALRTASLDALRELLASEPHHARNVLWKLLGKADFSKSITLACELDRLLVQAGGREETERLILVNWTEFDPVRRSNILLGFHDNTEAFFSTDLASALFDKSSSTTRDRHMIAAGLAKSMKLRRCEALLCVLLDRIGRYEDQGQQRTLEAFRKSARDAFCGK